MSSGAYVALSGLQSRAEQLNRLASDLANVGTAGYKAERSTTAAAPRPTERFSRVLESAIDVAEGPRTIDLRAGTIASTGRDLDLAIQGRGFFVVQTPDGLRYTRNGHFTRTADGTLATEEGYAVMGEKGPLVLPREGCAPEYFGDLANYVSADDPAGIRQAVLAALARGRSETLAELVRGRYTWRAAAQATREAYRKYLQRDDMHRYA